MIMIDNEDRQKLINIALAGALTGAIIVLWFGVAMVGP